MQLNGRGAVSLDSAENAESLIAHSTGKRFHSPSVENDERDEEDDKLTNLPRDVEEKLHLFLYRLLGLSQIEFNLVWHFAQEGNLTNFVESIEKMHNKIKNDYDHFDKRNAWAMQQHIKKIFEPLGAIAGGMIGHGHGGAVKKKRKMEQIEFNL